MIKQKLITTEEKRGLIANTTHGKPQYNVVKGNVQRIELHRGCPWSDIHDFCYEPLESEDFPIPEIVKNKVQILDMNLLARKDAWKIIRKLGDIRVNKKVVQYELVCGVDYRFLHPGIAESLKANRFVRPRLAWDGPFDEQIKIKTAIECLIKAGYKRNDIMVFMIVNWRIPYLECLRKLDLMKVWNVKVCDCCFDGGYKYAKPEHWIQKEMDDIRLKSRKHNQLVLLGMDPQESIDQYRNGVVDPPKEVNQNE